MVEALSRTTRVSAAAAAAAGGDVPSEQQLPPIGRRGAQSLGEPEGGMSVGAAAAARAVRAAPHGLSPAVRERDWRRSAAAKRGRAAAIGGRQASMRQAGGGGGGGPSCDEGERAVFAVPVPRWAPAAAAGVARVLLAGEGGGGRRAGGADEGGASDEGLSAIHEFLVASRKSIGALSLGTLIGGR